MNLILEPLAAPLPDEQPFEVVERKGLGHPDTICDALAEELSIGLGRFYRDRFGVVLHHNVDKALLWGGRASPAFGGGSVDTPIEIFLAGRATLAFDGVAVPVESIAGQTGRAWLGRNMHALDAERHVRLHCLVRPGSADLARLFARRARSGVALANDTSIGIGFAPLSRLEKLVLGLDRALVTAEAKRAHPEVGEDIKIMAVRHGRRVELTVACAFIDRTLANLADYRDAKAALARRIGRLARDLAPFEVAVAANAGDDEARGDVYLTVTGTSAEAGDDGQVGRGNRANGLITPFRPMTLEAVAGKNPVSHVGKLYNLAAGRLAAALVDSVEQVEAAQCCLVSRIGQPVGSPSVVGVRLRTAPGATPEGLRRRVEKLVAGHLAEIGGMWRELIGETLIDETGTAR